MDRDVGSQEEGVDHETVGGIDRFLLRRSHGKLPTCTVVQRVCSFASWRARCRVRRAPSVRRAVAGCRRCRDFGNTGSDPSSALLDAEFAKAFIIGTRIHQGTEQHPAGRVEDLCGGE